MSVAWYREDQLAVRKQLLLCGAVDEKGKFNPHYLMNHWPAFNEAFCAHFMSAGFVDGVTKVPDANALAALISAESTAPAMGRRIMDVARGDGTFHELTSLAEARRPLPEVLEKIELVTQFLRSEYCTEGRTTFTHAWWAENGGAMSFMAEAFGAKYEFNEELHMFCYDKELQELSLDANDFETSVPGTKLYEFVSVIGRYLYAKESNEIGHEVKRIFKSYDTNNDGYISFEELADVMRSGEDEYTDEELRLMFLSMGGADGKVTFEEFVNWTMADIDGDGSMDVHSVSRVFAAAAY